MNFLPMVLALLLIQNAAPPAQTASISGIVVESGTGKPIADASVVIIAGQSTSSPSGITSSRRDGTFSLTNLKQGTGTLGAIALGYVSAVYEGSGPGPLVWAANQRLTNIRIELSPAGTITGRVVNQRGDPTSNIAVQAVQLSYQNGKRTWRVVESRPTNDLGEYRLFWLNPGPYYIRTVQGDTVETSVNAGPRRLSINEKLDIQPPELIRNMSSDGTISDEAVLPIYYPGTAEPELAVSVEVRSGLTTRIDFQSAPVPVHRVRGRITGIAVETIGGNTVRLVPLNSTGSKETFPHDYLALESLIEGNNFEIGGVPPGSYAVLADLHHNGISMSSRATIDVRNSDVNDVLLSPTPNVQVAGSFLIDGDNSNGKSSYVFTQFQLRSKISNDDSIEGGIAGSSLTFDNVPAGDYLIHWEYLAVEVPGKDGSFPAYIESMRAGGQDLLQNGLHVDSSFDQPIQIVVRNDFGSISGRVTGSPFQFPEAVVVLVPSLRNDLARYKAMPVGPTGEFHFVNIAPGDYKLFASNGANYTSWQDPEFVAAHEVIGRDIKVSAGNDRTVDIPLNMGEPK